MHVETQGMGGTHDWHGSWVFEQRFQSFFRQPIQQDKQVGQNDEPVLEYAGRNEDWAWTSCVAKQLGGVDNRHAEGHLES